MKVTWTFNSIISKDSYTPCYFLYLVNHLKICVTLSSRELLVQSYTYYERSLVEHVNVTKLSV